jgi:energy-coupling factor transport system permease protein
VNFVYFAATIALAMLLMHPIALGISFVCAAVYAVYLLGRRAVATGLKFMLPMMLFAAALNPMFNHRGATILAFLPNGNPVTLEAILFGIAAAVMLAAVFTWFSCFNAVVGSDKLVYLFGRVLPALSLILSMSLRLVPRFRAQIKIIRAAQQGIGRDTAGGGFFQRARSGIRVLSILITWALENSIETADSMKARGYGLPGRTSFSVFRFTRRDGLALAYIAACAAAVIFGMATGMYYFRFFPAVYGADSAFVFVAYFLLGAFPTAINLREDFYWKRTEIGRAHV